MPVPQARCRAGGDGMNKPVKAQTPPASKSGGGESCTNFVHLRTSLAAIEAGITVATAQATTSRPLTEKENLDVSPSKCHLVSVAPLASPSRADAARSERMGISGPCGR